MLPNPLLTTSTTKHTCNLPGIFIVSDYVPCLDPLFYIEYIHRMCEIYFPLYSNVFSTVFFTASPCAC